jgi:hypothetical protein
VSERMLDWPLVRNRNRVNSARECPWGQGRTVGAKRGMYGYCEYSHKVQGIVLTCTRGQCKLRIYSAIRDGQAIALNQVSRVVTGMRLVGPKASSDTRVQSNER